MYATVALIAVPERRLVVSVLHRRTYVRRGEKKLIDASPFFIFNAPVAGSTIVDSTRPLGKRALHFPFRRQGRTDLLQSLWWFDRLIKSSTTLLNEVHQLVRALQLLQTSQTLRSAQSGGGASGIVFVGGTYPGFF